MVLVFPTCLQFDFSQLIGRVVLPVFPEGTDFVLVVDHLDYTIRHEEVEVDQANYNASG